MCYYFFIKKYNFAFNKKLRRQIDFNKEGLRKEILHKIIGFGL